MYTYISSAAKPELTCCQRGDNTHIHINRSHIWFDCSPSLPSSRTTRLLLVTHIITTLFGLKVSSRWCFFFICCSACWTVFMCSFRQPDKLRVVWTRRNRRMSSKVDTLNHRQVWHTLTCTCLTGLFVVQLHSWQPGIKNPYRGMVVWPVPENIDISVTLFKVATSRIHLNT